MFVVQYKIVNFSTPTFWEQRAVEEKCYTFSKTMGMLEKPMSMLWRECTLKQNVQKN